MSRQETSTEALDKLFAKRLQNRRRQDKPPSAKTITTFSRYDRLMLQVLKGFIMKCNKEFAKNACAMPLINISILERRDSSDFVVGVMTNVALDDSGYIRALRELFESFLTNEGVRASLDTPVTLRIWTEHKIKTITMMPYDYELRTEMEETTLIQPAADVKSVLFFTVNGDLKADLIPWQGVLAEILLYSPYISINLEFKATDPTMSFTSTLRAADMGYPITSLAYKRASLLHFYGATELVDVMEGQKVRQYKMYMLVNPNTGAHERPFIELKVLQNGFFVEPTLEALTTFMKTDWPETSIVIDDVYKANDVPVGFYYHTSGPIQESRIKNLLIIIEWVPSIPPRPFGDEPVTKLPSVLSKWVSLGFEKLRSSYPELHPRPDFAPRVRSLRSRNKSGPSVNEPGASRSDNSLPSNDRMIDKEYRAVEVPRCEAQVAAAADSLHDFYVSGFELDKTVVPSEVVMSDTTFVYDASSAYFVSIDYGLGMN